MLVSSLSCWQSCLEVSLSACHVNFVSHLCHPVTCQHGRQSCVRAVTLSRSRIPPFSRRWGWSAAHIPPHPTSCFGIENRLFSTALVVFTEPCYLCWSGWRGYAMEGIRLTERGVYATIMGGVGSYEG